MQSRDEVVLIELHWLLAETKPLWLLQGTMASSHPPGASMEASVVRR